MALVAQLVLRDQQDQQDQKIQKHLFVLVNPVNPVVPDLLVDLVNQMIQYHLLDLYLLLILKLPEVQVIP